MNNVPVQTRLLINYVWALCNCPNTKHTQDCDITRLDIKCRNIKAMQAKLLRDHIKPNNSHSGNNFLYRQIVKNLSGRFPALRKMHMYIRLFLELLLFTPYIRRY